MKQTPVLKLWTNVGFSLVVIATPYHSPICGFTQQPTKGDDRRHAGAVEEEEGGQTLQTDGVGVVGKVMRSLSLDVQDEPSKEPAVK